MCTLKPIGLKSACECPPGFAFEFHGMVHRGPQTKRLLWPIVSHASTTGNKLRSAVPTFIDFTAAVVIARNQLKAWLIRYLVGSNEGDGDLMAKAIAAARDDGDQGLEGGHAGKGAPGRESSMSGRVSQKLDYRVSFFHESEKILFVLDTQARLAFRAGLSRHALGQPAGGRRCFYQGSSTGWAIRHTA